MFSQEAFISTFVLSLSLCSAWGKGDCLLSVTEQSNHIILRASAEETERCLYLCDEHAPVTEFSLFVLPRQLCLRFTFKASGGVWKKKKKQNTESEEHFLLLMFGPLIHETWATTRWRGESYFTYLWPLTLLHGQLGQAKVEGNGNKLKEWEHMDL